MMKQLGLIVFVLVTFLLFTSCEKDTYFNEPLDDVQLEMRSEKMVPWKGDFLSVPVQPDLIACLDGVTGDVVPLPQFNAISGNATHLGLIDINQSPLIGVECSFNAETGVVTATLDITFKNKKGDGVKFLGASDMSIFGPASGYYEVIEGFGKFEGATGWMSTTGFLNANEGNAEFSADGLITQPNH